MSIESNFIGALIGCFISAGLGAYYVSLDPKNLKEQKEALLEKYNTPILVGNVIFIASLVILYLCSQYFGIQRGNEFYYLSGTGLVLALPYLAIIGIVRKYGDTAVIESVLAFTYYHRIPFPISVFLLFSGVLMFMVGVVLSIAI